MTATAYAGSIRSIERHRDATAIATHTVVGTVQLGIAGLCVWGAVGCFATGGVGWIILGVFLGINALGFTSMGLGEIGRAVIEAVG